VHEPESGQEKTRLNQLTLQIKNRDLQTPAALYFDMQEVIFYKVEF